MAERPMVQRRSPRELRELARRVVKREVLVTNDQRVIRSAFYLIMVFVDLGREAEKVGALIGYETDKVPGRGMNGYPIFTSVSFLHINDLEPLRAIIDEMEAALA